MTAESYLSVKNILVIAPHPDDESLGCGGLIAKLAAMGRHFHTVFVTDGGASHLGSHKWSRQRIATLREQEAEEALSRLGIADQPRTFLRLHDAEMPPVSSADWHSASGKVDEILGTFLPDLVLLPWRRDPHCDHRDSWRLVTDAICKCAIRPRMLEYTIWLEEYGAPNDYPGADETEPVDFDITAEMAVKRHAVEAHLSQTSNLIDDDPNAFRLSGATIDRLTGPLERYWRVIR